MRVHSPRISEKVSITQNEEYTASAFAYIEQGSIDIFLIFYNGTTETIAAPTSVTPTLNQWTKRSITAKAPAGTTQVAVMIYSNLNAVTTAYVDDISIGQTVKNPGFKRLEEPLSETWPCPLEQPFRRSRRREEPTVLN